MEVQSCRKEFKVTERTNMWVSLSKELYDKNNNILWDLKCM